MQGVCEEGHPALKEEFPSGVLLPLLVVLLFIWQAVKNGDDAASEIRDQCLNFRHNMLFMVAPSRSGEILLLVFFSLFFYASEILC